MNNRIKRFMDFKGLSPSELADAIGVQRSNITHVLHGRNNPSFQFITKMLEKFPEINAKWLLTGEGEMVAGEGKPVESQSDLFTRMVPPVNTEPEEPVKAENQPPVKTEPTTGVHPMPEILQSVHREDPRKIESIVIFYTDQTFKQYTLSK